MKLTMKQLIKHEAKERVRKAEEIMGQRFSTTMRNDLIKTAIKLIQSEKAVPRND